MGIDWEGMMGDRQYRRWAENGADVEQFDDYASMRDDDYMDDEPYESDEYVYDDDEPLDDDGSDDES